MKLDEASIAHLEWSHRVLRCVVLHTSPGEDVLDGNAHCLCTFGCWFQQCRENFDSINVVVAQSLEERHRLMHDAIRRLCKGILEGVAVDVAMLSDFEQAQVGMLADLASLKTEYLARSARLDALTGLPLRYGLEEEFNRSRAQAIRRGEQTVVVILDVDHFKRVNDEHGHAAGDLALRHIARLLVSRCRVDEPLFRYGGEEFLALMQAPNREAAQQGAERLLQALRDSPLQLPDGQVLSLRASAGLAFATPDDAIEDIVGRADQALYAAKAAGRDTWR